VKNPWLRVVRLLAVLAVGYIVYREMKRAADRVITEYESSSEEETNT
jgi:hypothetical protein